MLFAGYGGRRSGSLPVFVARCAFEGMFGYTSRKLNTTAISPGWLFFKLIPIAIEVVLIFNTLFTPIFDTAQIEASMRLFSSLCCGVCVLTSVSGSINAKEFQILDNIVSGGGFQGDVTITDDGLTVYSSADVSGVFKSDDGGLRFESRNRGLTSYKVASLAITPDNDQIIYAGTGNKGTSGGLFRSVDGGATWILTGEGGKAKFAGNHSSRADPVPKGHPRSNGDLIVVDAGKDPSTYTDDLIIAGTYKDGVRLFANGGDKELAAVHQTGFVRSVARNPAVRYQAYAAIVFPDASHNGIYRIDYTNPSAPASSLAYPTRFPEGLTVLKNGHVYGAIGSGGIVKYDGKTWTKKNSGLSTDNRYRQWTTVTGYARNGQDVVYTGVTNLGGKANGRNYSSIWRSEDGGETWTPLVEADKNVSDNIHGQTQDWWFRSQAFKQAGIGRTNSVVSSVAVARGKKRDSVEDDIIFVSGRGGIWKSDNGGRLWEPAVNNMQATSNRDVAVNPNNPDQVVLANTDYVVLTTSSGFESGKLYRDKPKGAESRGYDVIFDVKSDSIILGTGDRDTNNPGGGEVYVKSADKLGDRTAKWINTRLSSVTAPNNGRVRAVTYGYHDGTSATSQTILASVEGEGVFRFHRGSWSKSNGVRIGATHGSKFVWPDNGRSGVVYLLDLSAGLFRSNDGGRNWTDIWPEISFRNNNFYNTGFIAADDDDPGTLYLSIQGDRGSPVGVGFKVFRMTNADTVIFGKPDSQDIVNIAKHSGKVPIKRPGPLTIGPSGRLWLAQQQDAKKSIDAGLYVMDNPVEDTSFVDLTTDQYRNAATSPSGIDVSSNGQIYISQTGIGLIKISIPCSYTDGC